MSGDQLFKTQETKKHEDSLKQSKNPTFKLYYCSLNRNMTPNQPR